eukprot:10734851-Alexandrium_andersonii.AAC.1
MGTAAGTACVREYPSNRINRRSPTRWEPNRPNRVPPAQGRSGKLREAPERFGEHKQAPDVSEEPGSPIKNLANHTLFEAACRS